MISSLLHLVGLRPRVYYTLTNFSGGGGGKAPFAPFKYANAYRILKLIMKYWVSAPKAQTSKKADCASTKKRECRVGILNKIYRAQNKDKY